MGRERGREEQEKRVGKEKQREDSVSSDEGGKKVKQGPLSDEQREKLLKQKEQYEKAAEKLEDQLLKLKEQREALKQQGQKHEDTIMKENAKLQKEVKYRITYMKEYMEKIEKGLAEDAKAAAEFKDLQRAEIVKKEKGRESSRESSEDKDRKKKKKKKEKSRERSSNSSEESERKKKKKKKKSKNRDRSSESTASSDSEGEKKRKKAGKAGSMDEDMFRMVAEMKSRKKKTGSGEDVLVDLMGKMSESLSKVKNENDELSARCVVLENQNKGLKKQVEDLQDQLQRRDRGGDRDRDGEREPSSRRSERDSRRDGRDREDRDRYKSGSDPYRQDREQYKHENQEVPPPPPTYLAKPPAPVPPAIPKNAHNPNLEPLGPRKGSWARGAAGTGLEGGIQQQLVGYGAMPVGVPPPHQMVPPPMMVPKPDMGQDKGEDREEKYRGEERSDRREYGREDRNRDRTVRDKNDKIDLKEWVQPPEHQMDPSLMSLKEKMKAKEEGFRREEELRNRWVTSEPEPTPPPEPLKPSEQPIPENRPSVSIGWGQGIKKTPEPQLPPKKNAPLVGKMPWLKRGDPNGQEPAVNGSGRRSKFGPPVSASIPPPSLVTQVPTLGQQGHMGGPGGPPQDMIEQGYSQGYPQPPPPMERPPPGMAQNMEQQYGGNPHDQQTQMMMMAGYGYGMPPPQQEATPPPDPTPAPPPKPQRNPKPQSMDMNAMIAAAQQHMQKNLTTKLLSIGVPISRFGIPSNGPSETESIPLRGDPMGVDMDIADIPAPPMPDIPHQNQPAPDIPLPPELLANSEPDNQPGDFEDDCAPPGEDILPPGEGPDEDEMRMLGIDPGDAVVG